MDIESIKEYVKDCNWPISSEVLGDFEEFPPMFRNMGNFIAEEMDLNAQHDEACKLRSMLDG